MERLRSDCLRIDYSHQISIHPYYCEFLAFFSKRETIGYNDLVVATHMIYGWMPTMLRLNTGDIEKALLLLNDIKNGASPTLSDLLILRGMMNNSMVGPSKLLHFLDPERFAIWDSRIFRYITGEVKQNRIAKAINYSDYLEYINGIVESPDFRTVHDHVRNEMKVEYTKLRTAEIVMFETDKISGKRIT